MSTKTINAGQQMTKGPNEQLVATFTWADNLGADATIASQAMTPTQLKGTSASLAVDTSSSGLGVQADNQSVKIRLTGGEEGEEYLVTSQVTTNESPDEIKEQSFVVLVQQK